MPCEIVASEAVAGNCACGKSLDPPHLCDGALLCVACCPEHGEKPFKEWQGTPQTVTGTQGDLL